MNLTQGLTILVFILIFGLIIIEAIHRTYAALLGAFFMILIGTVHPVELLDLIEIEILGLIIGLFILVEGAERSGLFQLLASKIMKNSNNPTSFAVILLSFTMVLALLLSNIGAMLIMAAITITMAKSLRLNPQTILIFQAILINVGGMMLWMGSIPNVIIAMEARLSFQSFIINIAPLGVILFIVTLIIFLKLFRSELSPSPEDELRNLEFREWMERSIEISGWSVLKLTWRQVIAAVIMGAMIVGFIVYEGFNLTPAFVSLSAGCFMLMIQGSEPGRMLRDIDWSNILFLAGLFVMINGMEKTGLIEMVSQGLSNLVERVPLSESVVIMWLSGFASALIDNIPLTTSFAPIVQGMVVENGGTQIWWGLVIGANLGGNMTPLGSPSNIITLGVSEQEGYPIPFNRFLKIGLGLTLLYLLISTFYFYLRFNILVQ